MRGTEADAAARRSWRGAAIVLVSPRLKEQSMLRLSIAAIGLVLALGLGACDEQVTPPQEPAPGAVPPAE